MVYERFWAILHRFLSITLIDKHYHDACVEWYLYQSAMIDYNNYSCNVFKCKCQIYFLPQREEMHYMEYFYDEDDDSDYEYEYEFYKPSIDKVKPYNIHIYIDGHMTKYAYLCITTDELPSRLDCSDIIKKLQENIDVYKLKDCLKTFVIRLLDEKQTLCTSITGLPLAALLYIKISKNKSLKIFDIIR